MLGSNIRVIGITTEGMVIYSDGTNYSGVPLLGGPPTVMAPMTGIDQVAVVGSSVFYWGPSTYMVAASGCPSCRMLFPDSRNTGLIPNAAPIVSPDGTYYAFATGNMLANGKPVGGLTSLWIMNVSDTQVGVPLPILKNVTCVSNATSGNASFQLTQSDDLVTVYCDDSGDAGTVVRISVFQPNGNAIVSHEVDAVVAAGAIALDHAGKFVYYLPGPLYPSGGDLERISLSDFSTIPLAANSVTLQSISPDDKFAWCGLGLVSTQTGAVTALPPNSLEWFTDDWSFVVSGSLSAPSDTSQDVFWVQPVGGSGQVVLGTPLSSSYPRGLFWVSSLSNSTLLVRDGSTIRVFDASGKAPPIVVTDSVVLATRTWALSSDRKRVAYVSQAAPAGLYVVPLP